MDRGQDPGDPARNAPSRDEFGGILDFPWTAVELCLAAVHPRLMALAEDLLGLSGSHPRGPAISGRSALDQALLTLYPPIR